MRRRNASRGVDAQDTGITSVAVDDAGLDTALRRIARLDRNTTAYQQPSQPGRANGHRHPGYPAPNPQAEESGGHQDRKAAVRRVPYAPVAALVAQIRRFCTTLSATAVQK
jgi:hypothetical protein